MCLSMEAAQTERTSENNNKDRTVERHEIKNNTDVLDMLYSVMYKTVLGKLIRFLPVDYRQRRKRVLLYNVSYS